MRGVRPVFSQPKHTNFISAWGVVMTAIMLGWTPTSRGAQPSALIRIQDQQYQLHIDRGPLNSALRQLAAQTGLQIARFSDVGGETLIVGPLAGSYTPLDALRLILENTRLTFSIINPHTVALVPAESSASSLWSIRIRASQRRAVARGKARAPAAAAIAAARAADSASR